MSVFIKIFSKIANIFVFVIGISIYNDDKNRYTKWKNRYTGYFANFFFLNEHKFSGPLLKLGHFSKEPFTLFIFLFVFLGLIFILFYIFNLYAYLVKRTYPPQSACPCQFLQLKSLR